jgi:serine protease Do
MTVMERFALLLLCVFLTVPAFGQDGDRQREEFYAAAEHFEKFGKLLRQTAELATPAVVNIKVTQTRSVGRNRPVRMSEESGSGIIAVIAQKQVILTNRHVVEDAEPNSIQILTHDRRLLTPTKIAANEDFDIAVLEVAEKLPQSASFGDSDQVQVGNIVLAIGNPFELLDRSVSMGIISAVGRRRVPGAATGSTPRIDFFQTDAAVNPGSSGGMLINLRGEVIGVLTAIATLGGRNEGVAFVMPSNAVLRIAEQLVQTGTVVKPYIGFAPEAMTSEDRRRLAIDRVVGAKIKNIASDTPAERAGLEIGDVVLSFNGIEVEDDLHVVHLVAQSDIGKPVVLRINRNGELLNITVTPGEQLSR